MEDGGWVDAGCLASVVCCCPNSSIEVWNPVATKIDGPGLAKLETLEQAVTLIQRLDTVVERMAQSQRNNQPLAQFRQQVQRAAALRRVHLGAKALLDRPPFALVLRRQRLLHRLGARRQLRVELAELTGRHAERSGSGAAVAVDSEPASLSALLGATARARLTVRR